MEDVLKIIDTHCHAGENWFEPIESLIYQMERNNITKAILIQHGGYFNHKYLFKASSNYSDRLFIVVSINPKDENPLKTLENLASSGASGIRLSPSTEFSRIDSKKVWDMAGKLGLPVSVHANVLDLISDKFQEILSSSNNTKLILEHYAGLGTTLMGNGKLKSVQKLSIKTHLKNFDKVLEYSKYPNIFVKIHGLGEIEPRNKLLKDNFDLKDSNNIIKLLKQTFGCKKIMWGSDYPPVSGREGYFNSLKSITENNIFSKSDLIEILWETPRKAFNL